ncbi:membrane bound O-acyl transferase MBOAT family protein [Chthoniobacter flavus Ellin428]|uniref:Membrane bound O-acyl transferase MBOAT family protein n=2 Tax=Chthoniobacter flavus TaxID=191863 RepID=B4D2F1_9BACT|nr:MBOAT family O-acyltransferase [Chthoniobacter flavus]EDY19391.1 membrane bound O-acyl transferase MBOAT family protein [Chthoniobacter flavus Ellin428]
MPQFARPDAKRWQFGNVSVALAWLSIGLLKKVVIADACAPLANTVFGKPELASMVEAWAGALAYSMQLYFDFSGYSDMAIGLSLLFNVRLPDNFNAPYRAESIVDFWRRWHMTLSRFLRDYLYIPLGGNRLGSGRRYLNLFVTMAIGGLWHGAGWTFLVWGAFHGLLLTICHLWHKTSWRLPVWSGRSLTFLAVLLGWVIFRASSLEEAGNLFHKMTDLSNFRLYHFKTGLQLEHLAGLLGLLLFVNVAPTTKRWIETRKLGTPEAIGMALLFCLSLFLIRNVELRFAKSEFIYFRF